MLENEEQGDWVTVPFPDISLKGLERKQNLKPGVCSFSFLLREIIYIYLIEFKHVFKK